MFHYLFLLDKKEKKKRHISTLPSLLQSAVIIYVAIFSDVYEFFVVKIRMHKPGEMSYQKETDLLVVGSNLIHFS